MDMELKFEDIFTVQDSDEFDSDEVSEEQVDDDSDFEDEIDDVNTEVNEDHCEEPIDVAKSKMGFTDFELLKLVGTGGYGKVYQVRHNESNQILAMKVLRKSHVIKTNNVGYTRTERDILRTVKHPYIVSLYYAFQSEAKLYLVMDYLNGGQLFDHIHNEGLIDEISAKIYAAEMVLAIEHLHQLNVIHRDLKPENILLDAKGHICLTDFGLAYQIKDGERTRTYCGTINYMSPEMLKGLDYDQSTDWWSMGALLYEMLTGYLAFNGKNDAMVTKEILTKKLKLPRYLSPAAHSLIRGLLERDPAKRLGSGLDGIKKIKAHPFFKGLNWRRLLNRELGAPIKIKITSGMLDTSNFNIKYTQQPAVDSPVNSPMPGEHTDLFLGFTYIRSPGDIWSAGCD